MSYHKVVSKHVTTKKTILPKRSVREYATLVTELKQRIRSAQFQTAHVINKELIKLYWDIGKSIVRRQSLLGWGKTVVEKLARDLRLEFPGQHGFSSRNLWEMRLFYETYAGKPKLQQLVAELPWGHNLVIMHSIQDEQQREYYLRTSSRNGWSRSVLIHHIETKLYEREIKVTKTHNFRKLLPARQAQAIDGILKDPYIFDFISLEPKAKEHQLEQELLRHVRQFLVEMGSGFAFVGNQYRLQVGKEEFLSICFFITFACAAMLSLILKQFPLNRSLPGR